MPMVILKAGKVRAQAAGVEASLLALRARAHAVPANQEAVTNLVPRVPRVQVDPFVRVDVVRRAPVRKQVRALLKVANSWRALVQSRAVSTINIANLAKVVHVAQVARAVQEARVVLEDQAAPVAHVPQVRPAVRVAHPSKVVRGVRALANQTVEQNLDQAIQALGRHRKVMIGNRAGPQRMSLVLGLQSRRVVVANDLSLFRG